MLNSDTPIFRALCAFAFTAMAAFSAQADHHTEQDYLSLLIEVEDLRENPDNGLFTDRMYFLFHDGTFNLFDYGRPANEALRWFADHGYIDEIAEAAQATGSEWFLERIFTEIPALTGSNHQRPLNHVINKQARYLTWFARIYPSDDAFVGNEDPMRYEIMDENGNFLGPFIIDVYGSDILDAGTRENLEQDLIGLDRHLFDERGDPTQSNPAGKPVRPHPGFNGSHRNPDGEPVRLMAGGEVYCHDIGQSQQWCHEYDPDNIDFTLPGNPLFRLRITAADLHGGWSGLYYNPARSGEGFNIEFFDDDPPRLVFFWYTYRPDGSGEPMWLVGQGEPGEDGTPPWANIRVYETRGGSMASTNNPDTVERTPWGTAQLIRFSQGAPACRALRIILFPDDESLELDLPGGQNGYEYQMQRLTPDLTGLGKYCGKYSGQVLHPHP